MMIFGELSALFEKGSVGIRSIGCRTILLDRLLFTYIDRSEDVSILLQKISNLPVKSSIASQVVPPLRAS